MNSLEKICYGVLIILLLVLWQFEHYNSNEVMKLNDELLELVTEQRDNYAELVKKWQDSYLSLQNDYGKKIVECEQLKKVETPVYTYTSSEIMLLAKCVESEAGEYSVACDSQKFITSVILNRVRSPKFPDTITDVIYQKNKGVPQFIVTTNGALDKCEPSVETINNVYSVLLFGSDLPEYVLYFYSAGLKENWVVSNTIRYKEVQGSVFAYTESDKEELK